MELEKYKTDQVKVFTATNWPISQIVKPMHLATP